MPLRPHGWRVLARAAASAARPAGARAHAASIPRADCGAVASAACASRAGRRREDPCGHPGWAACGALPGHPPAPGVLLRLFAAGKGPGGPWVPPAAELGSLGAQRGERWPVPLCVCAHPLLPRGRGAPASHPPPCLGPLVVISPASAEYTYFSFFSFSFLSFSFFPPLFFWLCPTPDSLQCKTKCILKIPK